MIQNFLKILNSSNLLNFNQDTHIMMFYKLFDWFLMFLIEKIFDQNFQIFNRPKSNLKIFSKF
jgi:hypothetical protein